ncbi:rhomboid family intramembrane serine protease, partial [Oligoflexia bacterium]|nr:rhomboid family intramembrane serine protease [Oligoflexia bacterium]
MYSCPNCQIPLRAIKSGHGVYWSCPTCRGRAVGLGVLRKSAASDVYKEFWTLAYQGNGNNRIACPSCKNSMIEVTSTVAGQELLLDVCKLCYIFWFDTDEYERSQPSGAGATGSVASATAAMPSAMQPTPSVQKGYVYEPWQIKQTSRVPPKTRRSEIVEVQQHTMPAPERSKTNLNVEQVTARVKNKAKEKETRKTTSTADASKQAKRQQYKSERDVDSKATNVAIPTFSWQTAAGLFGLPVEEGSGGSGVQQSVAVKTTPWLTWLLAAVVIIASFKGFFAPEQIILNYGFLPSDPFRNYGATFLTYFVLHAGLVHLLSNVYFLLVFGDNVESYLGGAVYLLMILVGTVVGAVVHAAFHPEAAVVLIGASGGVATILTFYALQFPKQKLALLIFFRWFRISAIWVFG